MNKKKNVLIDKSFAFAVRIVRLYEYQRSSKKEFVLSKQLLRSGTAVGALIREVQHEESRADFIHKLSIAQKECDETVYWIELLKATNYLSEKEFERIISEAIELLKMIRSIILTTKQNIHKS